MIHDAVLPQLEALQLDRDRPLLAVDVDEVLVNLAGHLTEFAQSQRLTLKLTEYKLEGALYRHDGTAASKDEFSNLFKLFFETQTIHQRLYAGAPEALHALSAEAQIVILTNVPAYASSDRIVNLRGHGIEYPFVANEGPKGGPLRWLSERVDAPIAFIDDSPSQLQSAADLAPDVTRIHFVGNEMLRGFLGNVDAAEHHADSWEALHTLLKRVLLGT